MRKKKCNFFGRGPLTVVGASEQSDLLFNFLKKCKIFNLTVQNLPYRRELPAKENPKKEKKILL